MATAEGHPPIQVAKRTNAQDTVGRLLRSLPEWFGVETAIEGYVKAAGRLDTYLAWPGTGPVTAGEAPIGVLLAERHCPESAEVTVMAVERTWQRRGAGRALVDALAVDLVAGGVRLLQVKTLGPSHPDPHYAGTRRFYQALGFVPLEELDGLWPGNPCLIMVKVLAPATYAKASGVEPA